MLAKILTFAKRALLFAAVWFISVIVLAFLGGALGLADKGAFFSSVYSLSVAIIPIFLAFAISIPRKPTSATGKTSFFKTRWFVGILIALAIFALSAMNSPDQPDDINGPTFDNTTAPATISPTTEPPTTASQTSEEIFIQEFCEASGFSSEAAKSIYTLLDQQLLCEEVSFYKKHETGNLSWDIHTTDYVLVVTADEDGIYQVACGSYVMYDGENIVNTYADIAARDISGHEGTYYVIATSVVEDYLLAPSTASFSPVYECTMQRYGDIAAVQGYVDSQNSFGAMIRNDFVVEFVVVDAESLTYQLLYVRIGTEESGEFIDLN